MTVTLYLGILRNHERAVRVTRDDIARGYAFVTCIDCDGAGEVAWRPDTDEPERCVACKGSGRVLVNC